MNRRCHLPLAALVALAFVPGAARAAIPFDAYTVTNNIDQWPAAVEQGLGSGPFFRGVIHYDPVTHTVRRTRTTNGTTFYSDSIQLGVNPGHMAAKTDRWDQRIHACFYLELGGQGTFYYATAFLTGAFTVETVISGAHIGEYCAIDHRTDIGPVIAYVDPTTTPGSSKLRYASKESGSWWSWTLDSGPTSGPMSSPSIATNKQDATHIAWINWTTNTIRYCQGPGTTVETVAPAGSTGMAVVAVDKSGNPHIAYNPGGALVIADRVGGVWQAHTVLPASRDVRAFAFAYGYENQPYVVFSTNDTGQPLQCATPLLGQWLVQPVGTFAAWDKWAIPAIASSSGADPRLHLLVAWVGNGLQIASDQPNAIAFTRARLIACPDSDVVSKVRMWTTTRYALTSGPVTLDFRNGAVWDSVSVCGAYPTLLYGSVGSDTAASFVIKASGTVTGGVGVRYGGATGTLEEPSVPLAGMDQNGDGLVSPADRDLLVSRYGTVDPRSDLDFDGDVDAADRDILLAHLWHGCTVTGVGPDGMPTAGEPVSLTIGPNPMSGTTRVTLSLSRASEARIEVLDPSGRRVRVLHDGPLAAGPHPWVWDGRDDAGREVASGLYLVNATAEGRSVVARLVRTR